MGHYILLSRHSEPPQEDLERIAKAPGVTVLNTTLDRAMLVEASPEAASALDEQLDGWTLAEEAVHPRPGPARQELGGASDDQP